MGFKKYFTLSFDDGLEQDKRIIEILKQFGINSGATFNLNAGLFGDEVVIGRIGDIGFKEVKDRSLLNKKGIIRYVPHDRIPEDEIKQVYAGYEVASHAYKHESLPKLSESDMDDSIRKDVEALSNTMGEHVVGFAYPYGATSDQVVETLKKNGILYARTVKSSGDFKMPEDPYRWNPTCWMGDKKLLQYAAQFAIATPTNSDLVFYVWGHGYEFDFGTKNCNYDRLKQLCEAIVSQDDIVCCANKEVLLNK